MVDRAVTLKPLGQILQIDSDRRCTFTRARSLIGMPRTNNNWSGTEPMSSC